MMAKIAAEKSEVTILTSDNPRTEDERKLTALPTYPTDTP